LKFGKFSAASVIVLMLMAVIITFQITYVSVDNKYARKLAELESDMGMYEKLADVDEMFRSFYVGEIDDESVSDYIIRGYIAGTGDKYASYFNSDSFSDYMNDMNGELTGIGVMVVYNPDYMAIEIINVMPESPALEAGIQPGDLIIAVEGEYISDLGYYNAVDRLKGESGTVASFSVRRGEGYSEEIQFDVERAKVKELSVMSHMYESGDIGIIKILQFDTTTPEQFISAVESLMANGAKKLIFDVRYNPGGELQSIRNTLDYLLPEGPIVRIISAEGKETVYNSASSEINLPMAVLINGSTASAAELFAAALNDYDKATLVGTTTYGKGTMQSVMRLPDNSAVSISTDMYNPPYSENYEGVGVTPDIEVRLDEALEGKNIYTITDTEDNQLQAAIKLLNESNNDDKGAIEN